MRTKASRSASFAKAPELRPLLVIDGDLFAHRSYHALPKTILRHGRKPGGAILGFVNLCCAFTAKSNRVPCSSHGIRWKSHLPA